MDADRVQAEMESAFSSHLRDGTVTVERQGDRLVLNCGNWSLTVQPDEVVTLDLPIDNVNYYDDNPKVFLENVFSYEAEESIAMLDHALGGGVRRSLSASEQAMSQVLAGRLASATA